MARLTIRRGEAKAQVPSEQVSSIPVKTEETQQLETLLYLVANALDAKLERGFAGGIMLKEGGKASDFLLSVGLGLIEGEATEQRAVDTLVEHTRQEKGRTMVIQKLKKLFARLEDGKSTHRADRYFSFSTVAKAEEATRLLEGYGFGVKYKPGSRGFEITSLPENITESISALKKDIVEETKNAFRNNEEAALAFRRAERESTTRDLFADLDKIRSESTPRKEKIASMPKRREGEYSEEGLSKMDVHDAAFVIMDYLDNPSPSGAEKMLALGLFKRADVAKYLHEEFYPFNFFTYPEFKEFRAAVLGARADIRLVQTGTEMYELRKKQGVQKPAPWEPVAESIARLNRGEEATFIRASSTSAAETIAAIEKNYPGRAITWERSPEAITGGGHWEIKVLAEGERAPSIEQWLNSNFATASKDDSFYKLASIAVAGGRSKISFNREEMPKWLGTALDLKRSREEGALVFKEEFRRKLASRGVEVPESITGIPVYGTGKRRRAEPSHKGEKPTTIEYSLVFSGRGFQRTIELARAKEIEKGVEIAARKKEGEGRG